MTRTAVPPRRISLAPHANRINFLLFLTGAMLGCGVIWAGSLGAVAEWDAMRGLDVFFQALRSNVRFLLLLYLLAYMRLGAWLIPSVFGLEGATLGASAAAMTCGMGWQGTAAFAVMMLFRLALALPYGFVLGAWAEEKSMDYGGRHPNGGAILLVTALVCVAASALEASAARWLLYLMKFGV